MDVMVDIETLGTKPGCVVMQIGAVGFDEEGQKHVFSSYLSYGSQVGLGMMVDRDTEAWWQSTKELRMLREFHGRQIRSSIAPTTQHLLQSLKTWLSNNFLPTVRIWANSPRFDLGILAHQYDACGIPLPWNFRQERDLRTFLDDHGYARCSDVLPHIGTQHDALSDACYQADVVRKVWATQPAPDATWRVQRTTDTDVVMFKGGTTSTPMYELREMFEAQPTTECPTCHHEAEPREMVVDLYVRREK